MDNQMTEIYKNNPLHSLKLEDLLIELVDFYGWEILAAALNLNCFKNNPNIKASVKFLKKTEWARHKLEAFYLYRFKHLPRPDDKQFALPPRDRIIPEGIKPREPLELNLDSLERAQERKAAAAANKKPNLNSKPRSSSSHRPDSRPRADKNESAGETFDPWGDAKKKLDSGDSSNSDNPWKKS